MPFVIPLSYLLILCGHLRYVQIPLIVREDAVEGRILKAREVLPRDG